MAASRDLRYRAERDRFRRQVVGLALVIASELPEVRLGDYLDAEVLAEVRERLGNAVR